MCSLQTAGSRMIVVVVVGLSVDVDDDGHNTERPLEIHREPDNQYARYRLLVPGRLLWLWLWLLLGSALMLIMTVIILSGQLRSIASLTINVLSVDCLFEEACCGCGCGCRWPQR